MTNLFNIIVSLLFFFFEIGLIILFFLIFNLFFFSHLFFWKLARRISMSRKLIISLRILLVSLYFGRLFLKSCNYGLLQWVTCIVLVIVFEHNNCVFAEIEGALVHNLSLWFCLSCLGWAIAHFIFSLLWFAFFGLVFPLLTRFIVCLIIRNALLSLNRNDGIFV